MNKDLVAYYASRAAEYEHLYSRPDRQSDLARLSALLQDVFWKKNALEIACGTGYWTQRLALTAASVLATDINEAMLHIARAKVYPPGRVEFRCDDIFRSAVDQQFDGVFGGFIWSHILLERLDDFIARMRMRIHPGGVLVLADNRYVAGSSTPIAETDPAGNTYQRRSLQDGSEHLVLKNFPAPAFLTDKLTAQGFEVAWQELDYYWLAIGKLSTAP